MRGDDLAAEAAALKQKIRDCRKEMCDTQLINETGDIETIKLTLRVRKTLRGHLSMVCSKVYYIGGTLLDTMTDDYDD